MTTKTAATAENTPDSLVAEDLIRRELKRILASRSFRQVDRLQRFLSFIVEETLSGRGDKLKEYPIGVDVFGKPSSFDPRMDPIVRVQARRLRIRLATYYRDEGYGDDIIIELPKGGYTPTFRRAESIIKRPAGASLVSRNTVMISKFADYSAAGDCGYFCSGIVDEIVNSLSKEDSVIILSHPSGTDLNASERPPAAALIVGGSVRKSREVLRVTMHLNDAVRGCIIWSDTIDRNVEEIFSVQEEIAHLVLRAVCDELAAGTDKTGARRQTESLAAHNMYLQGRYHLNQRTDQAL